MLFYLNKEIGSGKRKEIISGNIWNIKLLVCNIWSNEIYKYYYGKLK